MFSFACSLILKVPKAEAIYKLEIAAQGVTQCKVSATRVVADAYWIEQTWRSQKCKYLRCL